MRVKCPTCDRIYDDAEFLTICPHDVTVEGQKYCRYHDLFDCPFPHHHPDESPPIPDEAWGPRPESVADAEDNLIYTVEVDRFAGAAPEPIAPTGVVIHFTNGKSQKVELVYTGLDLHGIHIWEVTSHPTFGDVERVTIDVMPPRTMVHIGGPGGP
jgi:hypothetical protein